MDESVSADEVQLTVAKEGDCKLSDVKVGKIGRTRTGSSVVWVQCPKNVAIALSDKKRIQIGWTYARVELLQKRALQCHKCWRIGHVKDKCKSDTNYLKCCFKCGMSGHIAPLCQNKVRCVLCANMGMNGDHRMGLARCSGAKMPASPNGSDVSGGSSKSSTSSGDTTTISSSCLKSSTESITMTEEEKQSDRRDDVHEDMDTQE